MKKNIAIVTGGNQSEVVVSLKSAKGIFSFINKEKYHPFIVVIIGKEWHVEYEGQKWPVDKNDFSFTHSGQKITFDYAYIIIHGAPGEDGRLQGYFDLIDLPYSSCGVLASALTFDKYCCNNYLRSFGIKVAESVKLHKGAPISAEEIVKKTGLPCFIKPNAGGSSFGVTKVKTIEEIPAAIEKAFQEDDEVIVERFLPGVEITNGIYKTGDKTVVLPVTEVVSKNEFFDFDAKYNGEVEEITPARLTDELTKKKLVGDWPFASLLFMCLHNGSFETKVSCLVIDGRFLCRLTYILCVFRYSTVMRLLKTNKIRCLGCQLLSW